MIALVVAIVGIAGTLLAAAVTQWATWRREARKWKHDQDLEAVRWRRDLRREELRWDRERHERREQWGREDLARLHNERIKAYGALLADARDLVSWVGDWVYLPHASPDLDAYVKQYSESMSAFHRARTLVTLIGSKRVDTLAAKLIAEVGRFASMGGLPPFTDEEDPGLRAKLMEKVRTIEEVRLALTEIVRRDLNSDSKGVMVRVSPVHRRWSRRR